MRIIRVRAMAGLLALATGCGTTEQPGVPAPPSAPPSSEPLLPSYPSEPVRPSEYLPPQPEPPEPTYQPPTVEEPPAERVRPPRDDCDPNYSGGCVPVASDVDCAGGSGNGPAYVTGPVSVIGEDVYALDRDGDGTACDS